MFWLLTAVTIVFSVARFFVPITGQINHADLFKDLAHLFVGLLFGYALATTINKPRFYCERLSAKPYWFLAISLTILEVIAFLVR